MCQKFFTVCTIEIWNSLPYEVVNAPAVNTFKNRLDRHWANQEVLYDYRATNTGTWIIIWLKNWIYRLLSLRLVYVCVCFCLFADFFPIVEIMLTTMTSLLLHDYTGWSSTWKRQCGLPVVCYHISCDSHKMNIIWVLLSKDNMHMIRLQKVPQYSLRSTWLHVVLSVYLWWFNKY